MINLNGFYYSGHQLRNTQLNRIYSNMLSRCYSFAVHRNQPYYSHCTVCKDWYNPDIAGVGIREKDNPYMHNAYEWFRDHFYTIYGQNKTVHLDKDIKIKGNMVYSPEACMFVPGAVNDTLGGAQAGRYPGLPLGVVPQNDGFILPRTKCDKLFVTPQEAFEVWKAIMEQRRDQLLVDYEGKIPNEVYDSIKAYTWCITD